MSDNKKSEYMETLLEKFSKNFGVPRSTAFKLSKCVICSGEAKDFRCDMSKKEYELSGMCQACQDSFFE